MLRFTIGLLLCCVVGCDRPRGGTATVIRPPGKTIATVKPITQLAPNRIAHVAVDTLGNIYYTLETERGNDGVVVVGENGVPRATQLTSANILAAMGESYGGSGIIQDIIAGPDGGLWFYFVGGKGRTIHVCVGQFHIRNETIQIVFDTQQLQRLSGIGDSILLTRGRFAAGGAHMFLLVRHLDDWSLFRFDNKRWARGIDLQLTRPFVKVWADDHELDLTRDKFRVASGAGQNLLLTDRSTGVLWQIDPSGMATLKTLFSGLPREMSLPVAVEEDRLLVFFAESPPLEADMTAILSRRLPQVSYPAFLEFSGNEITAIPREDFRAPGGFPVYAIRIQELIRIAENRYVAYDLSSGQLLRISLDAE